MPTQFFKWTGQAGSKGHRKEHIQQTLNLRTQEWVDTERPSKLLWGEIVFCYMKNQVKAPDTAISSAHMEGCSYSEVKPECHNKHVGKQTALRLWRGPAWHLETCTFPQKLGSLRGRQCTISNERPRSSLRSRAHPSTHLLSVPQDGCKHTWIKQGLPKSQGQ